MATRSFVLRLRITSQQYADATRQFRDGNRKANPLALALVERGAYKLSGCTARRITLIGIAPGRRHSGSVPAVLEDYLPGFQRGLSSPFLLGSIRSRYGKSYGHAFARSHPGRL